MKLPKNKIEAAADKEASRYTLNAVRVDVEKKRIMATNGHMLAIVPLEVSPEDHSTLIPLETVKQIRAMQKRSRNVPVNVSTNGKIVATGLGERMEAEPLQGRFPDCDAVIPVFSGPPTISFDVALLKRLCDALHAEGGTHVSLWIKDAGSAIVVKSTQTDDKGAIGVLMPVRA